MTARVANGYGRGAAFAVWASLVLGSAVAAECGPPARPAARCAQIAAAEALLARGDAGEALQAFEQAATLEHATDIELGLLRSQLQMGQFRRALAFAAHTAGAHGSDAGGAALYAWLLQLSGQRAFGARVLQQARARLPEDALLADVEQRLASGVASASGALLVAPTRFAPHASGDLPAGPVELVASGLLLDQGRRAVVPAHAVQGAARIWVRDGLGHTAEARPARATRTAPLAVLELLRPLGAPDEALLDAVATDAFPGSPASVVGYAGAADAGPAWPWLHTGFLGAAGADGQRRLGIDLPVHLLSGGPVFDLSGRLVGLTLGGANEGRLWLPASALAPELGLPRAARSGPAARLPADELYERSLRLTLQVLVAPGPGLTASPFKPR